MSVDGFGDFASTAWGVGRGNELSVDGRVFFPHSLGLFYQSLTQYLGFPHYGDEYKVMGLAPYGEPRQLDAMRKIVRLLPGRKLRARSHLFPPPPRRAPRTSGPTARRSSATCSRRRWRSCWVRAAPPSDPLEDRHRDIARSVQAMYEEAFFHLITPLQARSGLTDLVLAGGCAANSVANGKVRRMTPFRRVYVQSAAGDAGGAVGAAFCAWRKLGGKRGFVMDHALWGPGYSDEALGAMLAAREAELGAAGCRVRRVRRRWAPLPPRPPPRSPTARWWAGSRAAWSGGRGRSARARSSAIRAAAT